MDIWSFLDAFPVWLAEQVAKLSDLPPAYMGLAVLAPIVITLVIRDLLATLWLALFAIGALSLYAVQTVHWALFAIFIAAAEFLLVVTAIVRRRQNRLLRAELNSLRIRLDLLEAESQRKFMQSLRDPPPVG
jgi:hypothetical protein